MNWTTFLPIMEAEHWPKSKILGRTDALHLLNLLTRMNFRLFFLSASFSNKTWYSIYSWATPLRSLQKPWTVASSPLLGLTDISFHHHFSRDFSEFTGCGLKTPLQDLWYHCHRLLPHGHGPLHDDSATWTNAEDPRGIWLIGSDIGCPPKS